MKKIYNLFLVAILFCATTIKSQTVGTLTFKIGETSHSATYSGTKRCFAVWIEQNTTGTTWVYTKSLIVKGKGTPSNHIPTWKTSSASDVTGISSTSTLTWTAGALQTATWDGKNVSGAIVADGNYRVAIEETWDHGTSGTKVAYFPFTKGATVVNTTPTDASFTGITLAWAPTLAADAFVKGPEVVVYPIPSKGIFNIDFKSDVKNIQVIDMNGKVVYNEEVTEATSASTKNVDLSRFDAGFYMMNISDNNGTSTYKLVLEK